MALAQFMISDAHMCVLIKIEKAEHVIAVVNMYILSQLCASDVAQLKQ